MPDQAKSRPPTSSSTLPAMTNDAARSQVIRIFKSFTSQAQSTGRAGAGSAEPPSFSQRAAMAVAAAT